MQAAPAGIPLPLIEARGLKRSYGRGRGRKDALDGIDLTIGRGRIVGLIGPNGAGKSTTLGAILGLMPCEGHLRVLGHDPWRARQAVMRDVCFIADVAVLPRWMRVSQMLDYVGGVHPRFDRGRAEAFLARTDIRMNARVRQLSKGMIAQLHLALVMAIDAKLLVLDEPTLGLDLIYRKQFYISLLNDYFDHDRTILITTHQVEEVQDILTDVIFLDRGRVVLDASMEALAERFLELMPAPAHMAAARALSPVHEHLLMGRSIMLFDDVGQDALRPLGEVRTPPIADLFVKLLGKTHAAHADDTRRDLR